jgi:hypothetical protein
LTGLQDPGAAAGGSQIRLVRGQRVMLDSDLAKLYGVSTSRLNEQVKRNAARFPSDFVFKRTPHEVMTLISQIAISKTRGGRRKLPWAFTEHGAIMAANVLKRAMRDCAHHVTQRRLVPPSRRRRRKERTCAPAGGNNWYPLP